MATQQQPTAQTDGQTPVDQDERISQTALAVGNLPDAVKNALIIKRQQNIVAAQIAGTNWGKGLDLATRRALSDWAMRAGLDPATELDVLGGRFYKNAQYYQRRLSELVEQNKVVYAYVEHVENDPRLAKIAADKTDPPRAARALGEMKRREDMRIQYGIPDKAVGASIFHIMLTNVGFEFSAAKWCGGGTRQKDPVGDEFPIETSETRALRRGMRLIAAQNPGLAHLVEVNDDDTIDADIGETLRAGLLRAKNDQIAAAAASIPKPMLQMTAGDPYNLDNTATRARKEGDPIPVETATATMSEAIKSAAVAGVVREDPYQPEAAAAPSSPAAPEFIDDRDLMSPEERAEADRRK